MEEFGEKCTARIRFRRVQSEIDVNSNVQSHFM